MKLEVRDLSFWYEEKGRQILSQFSLSADSSERVGIIAPSGGAGGKSETSHEKCNRRGRQDRSGTD